MTSELKKLGTPLVHDDNNLALDRCPHCGVRRPLLQKHWGVRVQESLRPVAYWAVFRCTNCFKYVLGHFANEHGPLKRSWPPTETVSTDLPERARNYLQQAIDSIHAPSGAVMLAASAVDSMLFERGLREGKLFARIATAENQHLITPEMAEWAHEVRLDANDERHAEKQADLPTEDDARRCVDFAVALGDFLFVLPNRVSRGRSTAVPQEDVGA